MLKKLKCISLLMVTVFMLQSILIPAIFTAEAAVPQLSLMNFSNTSNSAELVWTSSDNSIKAASYDIYRDNRLVKTSISVTYTDTELIPETKYTYSVKAKNNSGKVIAESNALAVTTLIESLETHTEPDITESNISIPNIAEPVNITSSAIILKQIETKELEKMEQSKLFKNGNPDFETDRFIIKYQNENSRIKARKAFEKIDQIYKIKKNNLKNNKNINIDIILLNRKQKLKDFATDLKKNDLGNYIEYIQPDYQLKLFSNDPYYSSQWGLENNSKNASTSENMTCTTTSQSAILIDAGVTEEWNVSTGSGITVAVIDTGVDITHEDLAENIWVNTIEIPNNEIDDDGNGKIDDINGWNFSDDNNIVCDTYNMGNENHGTHVAGIIAAVKDNGKGIAGVAPCAKVMPLKVFKNGMAYTSDIINAIQYAENMGVRIVNCSWGSNVVDNTALKEAIKNSNMLFVCAAGNSSMNIDSNPVYPAAFDCSNIITVASVNKYGRLSSFSNYGKNSVDVAAPGEEIISTVPGNKYELKSGTSMAAAFVSGEAALILSENKDISLLNAFFLIKQKSNELFGDIDKMNLSGNDNFNKSMKSITLLDSKLYQASKDFSSVQGQNGWYYMEKTSIGNYNNMTWNPDRNGWFGSNTWCFIGAGNLHPDENDSVRKWVAPYSGTILISANGNIRKYDTTGGDGINVSVSKNNTQIWNAYIGGTDGVGIKFPERIVDVKVGDEIYFTLNKNQNNNCDGSIWDPIITYKDPLTYQASKDFSSVQGQNGWYYMEKTSTGNYNNMTWNPDRNGWFGSNTWCFVGVGDMHPDENDSVRKWVAPYSGTVLISANGNIRKYDATGGDGINISVSKNNTQIWNAYIGGTDGVGIKFPERIVDVKVGDEIYFTLNKNQNNSNDGSIWDPIITYKDPLIYQASKDFSSVQGQNGWYYMEKTSTGNYNNMTWNPDRNGWFGSNTWCFIGAGNLHPDENDSARKWVAPYSGTILISANGNIRKYDTSGGDGINVSVSKNNTQIWNAYIGGTDGVGIKFPERIVDVNVGDEIYFTLNKNQNNSNDGSIWDPIITYEDPLIYQASKDFSSVQGQNGWYYMEKTSTGNYNNMTWNPDRNGWFGSNTWCFIGAGNLHPDENDSARKWVAPYSGTILISANGNIRKYDTTGGDGINVSVSKNNTQIWNAYIGGTDGVGIKFPERIVDVNAGDEIYFTLNKNQDINCDGSIWDPIIIYKGPLIYQASKNYSSSQGQSQWYYMEKTSTGNYNNMTWNPERNCWIGSNTWCVIGADNLHPDENDSVRKWVTPYSGTVLLSANGNIRKYDEGGGDGINVSVSKNNTQIWNAYVAGTDGVGIKFPERLVDVNAGDEIYFTLNKNQNNYYDGSIWDPIIMYIEKKYEYQYDLNNQLITILKDGKEYIKFIYDNNGNLIKKQKL